MNKLLFAFILLSQNLLAQLADIQLNKLADEIETTHTKGDFEKEKQLILKAKTLIKKDDLYNQTRFHLLESHYLETTNISSDSCRILFQKAINLARKSGDRSQIIEALGSSVDYNFFQDSIATKNRSEIAHELKVLLNQSKTDLEKAKINGYLAICYMADGNDNESIKASLVALELTKKNYENKQCTSDDLARAYYTVSRVYKVMFQPEKQNEYLQGMRKYVIHNQELLVDYYSIFARNLLRAQKKNEAKRYHDSLEVFTQKYETYANVVALLEANVFFTQGFSKFGDLKNAKTYVAKANEIYEKWKFPNFEANINYTNGKVYFLEGKYAQAYQSFKKASETANLRGYGDLYQLSLENAGNCLEKLGDWKGAYKYSKLNALVIDSLRSQSTEAAFIETEAKFQNKEKQAQIEIKNLQIDKANSQKNWLLAGLAAVLSALGLLFWNYKTKQKANEIINEKNIVLEKLNTDLVEANQTKAKLFGIISHDLRSPISQVYQFLKLQELNPNLLNEKQKTDLSGKIQTATGSLLETMEDLLLWSKTQLSQFNTNIEKVSLKPIIDQCIDLMKLNIEAKNIALKIDISPDNQIVTDPYFLQIIIRNLLQNAIKASPENGEIGIKFNNNQISIENTGAIFSQKDYETILNNPQKQENLTGLGLKLVDELSQKIGANIRFENGEKITKANIQL